MPEQPLSKKKKAVAEGIFKAELSEFLSRTLSEDGFAGVKVRITPVKTQIIILATRQKEVLGENGRRIRELTSLVQKRFNFRPEYVELLAERVENRGLSAMAQAESLRYKLLKGLPVRRACYGVLRNVMESGAKGCEVTVSGKLRAQRAKAMKVKDGYMIAKGNPAQIYLDQAIRSVNMRQGVLGVKVKIMLPHDPAGLEGPKTPIPDTVIVHEPKGISYASMGKSFVLPYNQPVKPETDEAAQQQQQAEQGGQADVNHTQVEGVH